jgi:hypothetical protein
MSSRRKSLEGKSLLQYLLSRTHQATNGCREWLGPLQKNGYAKISYLGKHSWAHRVVYELSTGKSAGELQVMHKCDNRKCINPDHLEAGTRSDNMLDAAIKGRLNSDERLRALRMSRARKLSPSHVMAIRTRELNGED